MKKYISKNYKALLLFSITFFTLISVNYYTNQKSLEQSIDKYRISSVKYATISINNWLKEKIKQVNIMGNSISNISPITQRHNIQHILVNNSTILNFSSIYVGYSNNITVSSKKWNKPKGYKVSERPWYKETIKQNKITITNPYIDVGLKTLVVSICTPLKEKDNIKGVLCGIVELNRIKNEILNIPLPFKGESFLIDENQHIILHKNSNKLLKHFPCELLAPDKVKLKNHSTDKYIYYYNYLPIPKWYIIAKLNKHEFYKNINKQFLINLFIYLISIMLFILITRYFGKKEEEANKKYELQKKLKKEQDTILFQQSKMTELGETIGAISHQWKQPLNSLSILLGNLLQFKKMGKLNDEIFEQNINQALNNTYYLSDTINTFRNFYAISHQKQEFELKKVIEETILILEPYFKNLPIKIEIEEKQKNIKCYNLKNEFQQIITSLILNSRYFLLEDKENNQKYIKITISENEDCYELLVEDNACGIKEEDMNKIFKPFYTTKKEKGTGLGLYLSYLIAREKLHGKLEILSYKNPTIFLLNIQKKEEKND